MKGDTGFSLPSDFMKLYIDVTNMLGMRYISGIQRVEHEIISRFLSYKTADITLLAYSPEINAFHILDSDEFAEACKKSSLNKTNLKTEKILQYEEIPSGAVFFDIDNVWKSRLKRSYLLPILKKNAVKIISHVYDINPIQFPSLCDENTVFEFIGYIGSALMYSDLIITSTNANLKAMTELCGIIGIPQPETVVAGLGCDYKETKDTADMPKNAEEISQNIAELVKSRYILSVGTIEPRKNHKLIIDALDDKLSELDIKFVFAGRFGWNVEELKERILNHKLLNKKLFFIESPDDATVNYLYDNAFAVAFPTFNEGFGLPVIEAFQHGVPVLASDIDVLREVGGEYAVYFNPNDKKDFTKCVSELIEDNEKYSRIKNGLKNFVPYTWDESARKMMNSIISVDTQYMPKNPENPDTDKVYSAIYSVTAENMNKSGNKLNFSVDEAKCFFENSPACADLDELRKITDKTKFAEMAYIVLFKRRIDEEARLDWNNRVWLPLSMYQDCLIGNIINSIEFAEKNVKLTGKKPFWKMGIFNLLFFVKNKIDKVKKIFRK